jgi:hypothetical protein
MRVGAVMLVLVTTSEEMENHAAFLQFSCRSFKNWCAAQLDHGGSNGAIAIVLDWMVVEIAIGVVLEVGVYASWILPSD